MASPHSEHPDLLTMMELIAAQIDVDTLRELREAHDAYDDCAASSMGQTCCIDLLTSITDAGGY